MKLQSFAMLYDKINQIASLKKQLNRKKKAFITETWISGIFGFVFKICLLVWVWNWIIEDLTFKLGDKVVLLPEITFLQSLGITLLFGILTTNLVSIFRKPSVKKEELSIIAKEIKTLEIEITKKQFN